MGAENVVIALSGRTFAGVETVEIEAAFDRAARTFHFGLAPGPSLLQTFAPGTPLQISSNGALMCAGYVDRLQPAFKQLDVSGRSAAQDFIDCAAIDPGKTGNFRNRTLLQIAQALAQQFGTKIATDQQLDTIESYQITPGEKAFSAIEKIAREAGLTLCGQPDGSILITRPGTKRHAGGLFEGQNIKLDARADLNAAHRHSPIIVRGQSASGTDQQSMQIEATASDSAVPRYRPLVVVEDRDLDQATAQALANARSQREAGESLKATISVQGFHDSAGMLWTPGYLVWTESPMLGLAQAMLIRSVAFKKARRGGSVATLHLVDPRAFGGTAAKGSVSGKTGIWHVDAPPVPNSSGTVPA